MSGRSSSAVDTVNAAASAFAAGDDNRTSHATIQKRRWGGFLRLTGCVVSRKHRNRIVDAVVVPDAVAPRVDPPASETLIQAPSIVFPFVAPPSSPASLHHSEPASLSLSPSSGLSPMTIAESMYSPEGPASMFAIGPYAHETQLVTPPVPSTYTTEPSTAPFTPPPESTHITTPSSPEVPFARLLDPIHQNGEKGTLSPIAVGESVRGRCQFIDISTEEFSKLVRLENRTPDEWGSRQGLGTMTSDALAPGDHYNFVVDRRMPNMSRCSSLKHLRRIEETVGDHRLSFEITAEEVTRCVEKKPVASPKALLSSLENGSRVLVRKDSTTEFSKGKTRYAFETFLNASGKVDRDWEGAHWRQKHRPMAPISAKEFNFDSVVGRNQVLPFYLTGGQMRRFWRRTKISRITTTLSFPRCRAQLTGQTSTITLHIIHSCK